MDSQGFALIDLRNHYYHFSTREKYLEKLHINGYRLVTNQRANNALIERIPYTDTSVLFKLIVFVMSKDYKLQVDELNNPLLDAKICRKLYEDEISAFHQLPKTMQRIFFSLLWNKPGFQGFFRSMNEDA